MKHALRIIAVCILAITVNQVSSVNDATAGRPFSILMLGDSITKGVRQGVAEDETFSAVVERELRGDGYAVEVIREGIGGERTDQALERLERDVIARDPDIVTVMYGTNDAYVDRGKDGPRLPAAAYEKNLREIVTRLKTAGIGVVLMTEPPLARHLRYEDEPYRSHGENFMTIPFMDAVRRTAVLTGVPLVDNYQAFAQAALDGGDVAALMTDGMHPNPEGHRLIARTMLGVLGKEISLMPPEYNIPTVDITAETSMQVVIDREPGQYLGHPTTVLLEDNRTMVCVYPKGHGRGAVVMKRSDDAGLTWSGRLPVPDNWSTSQEVPTIYRTVGPAGNKRLIMFSGLYPIRMAVSEDDGAAWTQIEPIGDYGGIVAMADCIRLRDGRYMAFFHDDGRFFDGADVRTNLFEVFAVTSGDGGLTWSKPSLVACHPVAHLCEPGLVRSPDGSRLAMLLRENSRKFNSFVTFSDNEGATWSEPRELPASLTSDRHQAVYTPDGRLVIVFRDTTRESPTKGDFVAWVGTWRDIADGGEGQYRVRLLDNTSGADCGYPGIHCLPDGTVIATTYGHWTEGAEPYIMSVRFTLGEIDSHAAR